jgi:hypothetical protein
VGYSAMHLSLVADYKRLGNFDLLRSGLERLCAQVMFVGLSRY